MLVWRAAHQPEQVAYTYLLDGESEEIHLTYGELDRRARSIGARLVESGATGERVVLFYHPGLDFICSFFACLYAGCVAVPAHPTQGRRFLGRLEAVVADAAPMLILGNIETFERSADLLNESAVLRAPARQATDAWSSPGTDWHPGSCAAEKLAMLQYTSGSTGSPKGVMVAHGNLVHNLTIIRDAFRHTARSRGVIWLPPYHDMGLIGGVLQPLFAGFPVVLMSPTAFTQRPLRWLQAVSRYGATTSGGPNFSYDLCVRRITSDDREHLDLSSWDVAFNGAEIVRKETMDRFVEAFEPCGFRREAFYPCYGLAETTLMVSGGEKASPARARVFERAELRLGGSGPTGHPPIAGQTLVSSGRVRGDLRVVIADPDSEVRCAAGTVGEVWVSGGSVAQGYWNRPEETERTFRAHLKDTGEGPYLRTGDLGLLDGGELFIPGRVKHLIIVRGTNHYPQDIERTVGESHRALAPDRGAAFSVVVDDEERLVVAHEIQRRRHRDRNLDEVFRAVREAIAANHGLQVHAVKLLKPLSLPVTSSGKIQRLKCREQFLAGTLRTVGEWPASDAVRLAPTSVDSSSGAPAEPECPRGERNATEIESWLASHLCAELGLERGAIDVESSFASHGLDSVQAVRLAGAAEAWLGIPLSATLVYEYPTIRKLAGYLARRPERSQPGSASAEGPRRVATRPHPAPEPIALVGIGCRFPGASGPDEFWHLLRDGVDAITEVPEDRWALAELYDPDPEAPGKIGTRWGGFLEHVDRFDPQFFGISPHEAARMDPQQRLLLEVAWEAMESAGLVVENLAGTRTGVFVGISGNEYGQSQLRDLKLVDAYSGTGNALSIAANRLSYVFDLRGPSLSVDTACSSSLVAVHMACRSLWSGESDLVLVGGANLILSPAVTINFTKTGALAPDGRCKAFDARADGYVRSEGVGVVILKPLSSALADRDSIYAVIRGTAVNQDGRTNGLMAPSRRSQEAVLREAYASAGISPGRVQYVEAHGTGTHLGDPIEAEALGTVLASGRVPDAQCVIGSVKTNIGHLEAAAGIAGLIKVALSLEHGQIPPSLHFRTANPHIPLERLPLRIAESLLPWPEGPGPACAGVSSFGFGGTNAHVVLEAHPRSDSAAGRPAITESAHLLPISARSEEALRSNASAFREFLTGPEPDWTLDDVCYSAGARRTHHDLRLALVGRSREEFAEAIRAFLEGRQRPGRSTGRRILGRRPRLAFVFSGQGCQWLGMGRELLAQEPVFAEVVRECDRALRDHVDWSLLREMDADEAHSRIAEIDVVQPMLFTIQVGLAALWRSWGVEPDAVVGHSMGEVAAACVAGALSTEEGVRVICGRSRLLSRLSGQGAMAVVELPAEWARELPEEPGQLSVAASNSPSFTVLSGNRVRLEELIDELSRRGVFCRMVDVDVPAHTSQVDPVCPKLVALLEDLTPRAASVRVYSTVTGAVIAGEQLNAGYWARNVREPVDFAAAVAQLAADGHDTFLEISPHPILTSAVEQGLHALGIDGVVLPSMRRGEGERATLLDSLGTVYVQGGKPAWHALESTPRQAVRLPTYAWQRERHWLEGRDDLTAPKGRPARRAQGPAEGAFHPALGPRLDSSVHEGTSFWEPELDPAAFPLLGDHRIQGEVVLPAAVLVELVLAAVTEVCGPGPHTLLGTEFKRPLVLGRDGHRRVQLIVDRQTPGTVTFQLRALDSPEPDSRRRWPVFARGRVRLGAEGSQEPGVEREPLDALKRRCQEPVSRADHYRAMEERGLQYGSGFQVIERILRREGEALARLVALCEPDSDWGAGGFHPALLDACFQLINATVADSSRVGSRADTYVPARIRSLWVGGEGHVGAWGHSLLVRAGGPDGNWLEADVRLLDEGGDILVEALGVRLVSLAESAPTKVDEWCYELQWQLLERPQPAPTTTAPGTWLVFADGGGLGESLCEHLARSGEECVEILPGSRYECSEQVRFRVNPTSPGDFEQVLVDAMGPDRLPCRGIVHLWSLDVAEPDTAGARAPVATQVLGCISALHLTQALARFQWTEPPHLWLLTRGAQPVEMEARTLSVSQAPLWGLGRVLDREHPDLPCSRIDLDPAGPPNEAETLFEELRATGRGGEVELAIRGNARYAPRLVALKAQAGDGFDHSRSSWTLYDPTTGAPPFRLEIPAPGILDELTLRRSPRREPEPGEIEIRVRAAGLNFIDVMLALGIYPGQSDEAPALGFECAGEVVAVGSEVEGIRRGDEVLALAPSSLGAYATTLASLTVLKPTHLDHPQAGAIPIAFSTAYHALHHLAGLQAGERALIHSASGGVGLAGVQIARLLGAEVLATAGSKEKRAYLRSLGIECVMDSRSLAFAEQVMEYTAGEGVAVVLNSLAGEAAFRGLSILAPYGRFVEIGKRDIYGHGDLGLWPFHRNLSYFALDLARMATERPESLGSVLREVIQHFEERRLEAPPLTHFPFSRAGDAIRHMSSSQHIGKIVLSLGSDELQVAAPVDCRSGLSADRTYLIAGGLGGLGLATARWMVDQGVRHLALLGRSAGSPGAQRAIESLRSAGAQVVVKPVDIADGDRLDDALQEIRRSMPPLTGVVHSAGVLDDGILLQLDRSRLERVMAPKVDGSWNLHIQTLNDPLEFFVLYSSAASLLGPPGQASHAAANAFMDALAHLRHAQGRPALSIDWGPWAEVGQVGGAEHVARFAGLGVGSLRPDEGIRVLSGLLAGGAGQVAVIPVDWRTWQESLPRGRAAGLLAEVTDPARHAADDGAGQRTGLSRRELVLAAPRERRSLMVAYLRERVANQLGLSTDRLDVHQPLNNLGVDSLMAIQLRNQFERDLQLVVPLVRLVEGPSVARLAELLADEVLGQAGSESAPPVVSNDRQSVPPDDRSLDLHRRIDSKGAEKLLAGMDEITDAGVDALLRKMMSDREGLG